MRVNQLPFYSTVKEKGTRKNEEGRIKKEAERKGRREKEERRRRRRLKDEGCRMDKEGKKEGYYVSFGRRDKS